MRIKRPGPEVLVLSHSRRAGLWGLVWKVGFFTLWYWIVLEQPRTVATFVEAIRGIPDSGVVRWGFLAVPLLSVPSTLAAINWVVQPEVDWDDVDGST